jgi:hypothetical protein
LQAQHWTLSGLADVGFQTNPAYARSCALGEDSGHAALDFGAAFFERELVRLDFEPAAPSKVARRAWYDAIVASMTDVPKSCRYVFAGFCMLTLDLVIS